jgi:hypothetical protein
MRCMGTSATVRVNRSAKGSRAGGRMQRKTREGVNLGGRPSLPASERLSERLTVNLTRAERRTLRRLARAQGEREGAYIRRVLLRHLAAKGKETTR